MLGKVWGRMQNRFLTKCQKMSVGQTDIRSQMISECKNHTWMMLGFRPDARESKTYSILLVQIYRIYYSMTQIKMQYFPSTLTNLNIISLYIITAKLWTTVQAVPLTILLRNNKPALIPWPQHRISWNKIFSETKNSTWFLSTS